MTGAFAMNSYLGKQILALVRGGDYAHAGEEDAIERALASLPKDRTRRILDAGSGRGGTAAYMQRHGWGAVTGIDIEPKSIDYASQAFPEVTFANCDILEAGAHVAGDFDAVTLFNVLYSIPAQAAALRSLASRTRPGATLMIFDYVDLGGYATTPVMDAGRPFVPHPLVKEELPSLLLEGGWQLQSSDDLTADYERWYAGLVGKIEAKREAITSLAGADAYEHVLGRYAGMLAAIREGRLGGAVIYAENTQA